MSHAIFKLHHLLGPRHNSPEVVVRPNEGIAVSQARSGMPLASVVIWGEAVLELMRDSFVVVG